LQAAVRALAMQHQMLVTAAAGQADYWR